MESRKRRLEPDVQEEKKAMDTDDETDKWDEEEEEEEEESDNEKVRILFC